jgi:hypothetical protein
MLMSRMRSPTQLLSLFLTTAQHSKDDDTAQGSTWGKGSTAQHNTTQQETAQLSKGNSTTQHSKDHTTAQQEKQDKTTTAQERGCQKPCLAPPNDSASMNAKDCSLTSLLTCAMAELSHRVNGNTSHISMTWHQPYLAPHNNSATV